MNATPTVHLVDDDASFLTATARFLRSMDFQVKTFSSAHEFLLQTPAHTPGCAIVDLHMPGMDGLELQTALARTQKSMPIVFLTGSGDISSTVRAMRHGAEDFLEKLDPEEKLLDAVRRALSRDLEEREKRARRQKLRARFARLTERELEILSHAIRGRLNKEIADDLGIHERTVKAHRMAITRKMEAPSIAVLTRLALDAGIFAEAPECSVSKGQ